MRQAREEAEKDGGYDAVAKILSLEGLRAAGARQTEGTGFVSVEGSTSKSYFLPAASFWAVFQPNPGFLSALRAAFTRSCRRRPR